MRMLMPNHVIDESASTTSGRSNRVSRGFLRTRDELIDDERQSIPAARLHLEKMAAQQV